MSLLISEDDQPKSNPAKVICRGEGLQWGYVNLPIRAEIDTRKAGPGELVVFCEGPMNNADCNLSDHGNGTMSLTMNAVDVGYHRLYVKYDDLDVAGSPFIVRVSPASLVKLKGPGLRDGLLEKFDGVFTINSTNAGSGAISLRVGGPKGAFKVETKKEDKKLVCRYNPTVAGFYQINILWLDDHLPGSPYRVFIADSQEELDRYHDTQLASTA